MRMVEIAPLGNGAHRNQMVSGVALIPDGWAMIPDDMDIPGAFPFVNITAETGIVTAMTAAPVPEPTESEDTPSFTAMESATAVTFVTLCEMGNIDVATASKHAELFSPWAYPVTYKTGNIRNHDGKLYRCLQDHTSQETWTPDAAPSLWVGISDPSEEWPEWSQPVGSTDAYAKGDKVTHNGKHWTSDVDANVWEPGVYGWTEA